MKLDDRKTVFWFPILFGLIALALSAPLTLNESGESNANNNGTFGRFPEGSDYNTLIQMQRNVTRGGGGYRRFAANSSSSSIIRNGTFLLGINATDQCLGQTSCVLSLRDKQLRLLSIRNHVLNSLGMGKVPTMGNRGTSAERPPSQKETNFSGKIQTFYASCQIPAKVDKDVWNTPEYFHLYFDFSDNSNTTNSTNGGNNGSLPVVEPSPESSSMSSELSSSNQKTTISAKLRLFKIGTPQVQPEAVSVPVLNSTGGINGTDFAFVGEPLPLVEEKIFVSVFWYRSPVTKHHYKKKILDTKVLSVKESKWVEFDIINAAVYWLDKKETNFGLVVQVTNEDDVLVDPSQYFVNIPCSDTGSEPIVNPPSVEICSLSTPQTSREVESRVESPSFFPFPMGESFAHLGRVAKAHANAKNNNRYSHNPSPSSSFLVSGPGNPMTEWQNDELREDTNAITSTPTSRQGHRHRHGHGARGKINKAQNDFKLDEDHPLRSILATVASNVNSRERTRSRHTSRRHQNNNHNEHHHLSAVFDNKDSRSGEEESGERDIIIQKIYITSPNQEEERER